MSGNKATFYRLPTKSELNSAKTPGGKPTNFKVLTKENVDWAMNECRDENLNFDKLSTTAALNLVKDKLEDAGYSRIDVTSNTITGPGGAEFYVKKAHNDRGFAVREKK